MGKIAHEVAGFVALPVQLPSALAVGEYVTHYIYLKPHDPQVADEDASRSLFLVNIPVTTTEADLRHLLITQLQGGRIENVHFSETTAGKANIASSKSSRSSRKRKRMTAEEIEVGLDGHGLPEVWPSEIHSSGVTAIVVFVDRPSMELALKAARKAAKTGQKVIWRDGLAPSLSFGLKRYERYHSARSPSRRELLKCVDGYMSAYAQMEEVRSSENAKKRAVPDEDGFITVTRGSKGTVRADEAKEAGTKQREKDKGLEDFYRFQMREKRKEKHDEMLQKWEGDKAKMAEMRQRRANG